MRTHNPYNTAELLPQPYVYLRVFYYLLGVDFILFLGRFFYQKKGGGGGGFIENRRRL
jgi:hypothetical protein